eukprot:TRINITY_DN16417_c0_g1_i2.p1 TRINITY_DN16417_c0_g1~~TRINITY_DN16417_c0_g1_i2.p1  ORF type:complete len:1195 (+),score=232.15 TRINITY_DN16417_c0_g1_i2:491-3586(+)
MDEFRAVQTAVTLRYSDTLLARWDGKVVVCGLARDFLHESVLKYTHIPEALPKWVLNDISQQTGVTFGREAFLLTTTQWNRAGEEEVPERSWALDMYYPGVFRVFGAFSDCQATHETVDLLKLKELVTFKQGKGSTEVGEVSTLCGSACVVSFKTATWFGGISILSRYVPPNHPSNSTAVAYTGTPSQCEKAIKLLATSLTQQKDLCSVPAVHNFHVASLLPELKKHSNLELRLVRKGLVVEGLPPFIRSFKKMLANLFTHLEQQIEAKRWENLLATKVVDTTKAVVDLNGVMQCSGLWGDGAASLADLDLVWGQGDRERTFSVEEIKGEEVGLWSAVDVFCCQLINKVEEQGEPYQMQTGAGLLGASGLVFMYPVPMVGDVVLSPNLPLTKSGLTPHTATVTSVDPSGTSCQIESNHRAGAFTVHSAAVHIVHDALRRPVVSRQTNAAFIHSAECILSNPEAAFISATKDWFASILLGYPSPGRPKFVKLVISNEKKEGKTRHVGVAAPRTGGWVFGQSVDQGFAAIGKLVEMKWDSLVDDVLLRKLVATAKNLVVATRDYSPVTRLWAMLGNTKHHIVKLSEDIGRCINNVSGEAVRAVLTKALETVISEWASAVGAAEHMLSVEAKVLREVLVSDKVRIYQRAGPVRHVSLVEEQTQTHIITKRTATTQHLFVSGPRQSIPIAAARLEHLHLSHPPTTLTIPLHDAKIKKMTPTTLKIIQNTCKLTSLFINNDNYVTLRGAQEDIYTALCMLGEPFAAGRRDTSCEYCKGVRPDIELMCGHWYHKKCVADWNGDRMVCKHEGCEHEVSADERLTCGLPYHDGLLTEGLRRLKEGVVVCQGCDRWLAPSGAGVRCPGCGVLNGSPKKHRSTVKWAGYVRCSRCDEYPLTEGYTCLHCSSDQFCVKCVSCGIPTHESVKFELTQPNLSTKDTTCPNAHPMIPSFTLAPSECYICHVPSIMEGFHCAACNVSCCFTCKLPIPSQPVCPTPSADILASLDPPRAAYPPLNQVLALDTSVLKVFTNSDSLLAE